MSYKYQDLTKKIISCFYNVYNELGYGFLESVYENSIIKEFKKKNLKVQNQKEIDVYYRNEIVGNFIADIIVDDKIIIEVKAVKELKQIHEVQLVNYLKATKIEVGLLVNFGEKLEFKRKVFTEKNI